MMNMKKLVSVVVTAIAFAVAVPAQSQSTKHNFLDLEAAKRDIRRLEHDRAMAKRNGDWKKVAQDDRLIADDKVWVRRYEWRLRHRGH